MHGVGRYDGDGRPRAIGGVERDYLAARVPGRRQALRARPTRSALVRKYTGGETPTLQPHGRRRLREDAGPRAQRRCARSPQELVVLYRRRLATPGHAFGPDTPWQHEIEEAFPYEETPDQAAGDRRRQGRHGAAGPDGPPGLRRRRLRQDRGRGPRRVQGGAGRQAGRGARADHAARQPARPDVPRALRQLPGARRGALAVPHRRRSRPRSSRGVDDGRRSTS